MPVGEGKAGIDHLREAVSRSIGAGSLRQVARDVGMSPSGLQKFLDGARPYAMTRDKLERWYVREGASPYGAPTTPQVAAAAVRLLMAEVPGERGADARRRLLELLHDVYGENPPEWLGEL